MIQITDFIARVNQHGWSFAIPAGSMSKLQHGEVLYHIQTKRFKYQAILNSKRQKRDLEIAACKCRIDGDGFYPLLYVINSERKMLDVLHDWEMRDHVALMDEEKKEQQEEKPDMVEHPTHYCRPGEPECIEAMKLIFGPEETAIYCKLANFKYLWRGPYKDEPEVDRRKMVKYLGLLKECKDEIAANSH